MTLEELTEKMCECHDELKRMGAFGGYLFDCMYGDEVSIHTNNDHLPEGKTEFDYSVYPDKVIKSVVIGRVTFFAIISKDVAKSEDSMYWGALI